MKARIKRNGQVIDVVPVETRMETDGIHAYYTEAGSEKLTSLCLWKDTELDFNVCELSKQDWSSFRREVAKDILCSLVKIGEMRDSFHQNTGVFKGRLFEPALRMDEAVSLAIEYADELIKQLQEEKK